MIPVFQMPRNSLAWLLVAQTLLILPHLPRLPLWILLAWFVTVVWRVQIFRGVWSFPRPWVKGMIVLLCIAGLFTEYDRFFGIEPMVGLLVTAFLLKLLEMRQKRDALIVVFLGYFVAATQFLFFQTLLTTLYVMATVVTLTTALLGIHQSEGHRRPWRSLTLAGTLVGQSVPLMIVLFIIMPRVGSLWAVPQPEHSARTGMGDTMAPGDFSNLVQDDSTAFRVTFSGGVVPPPRNLYWRGLVLSDFDGERWTRGSHSRDSVAWNDDPLPPWRTLVETEAEPVRYQVMLEPTQERWLYALPFASSQERQVGLTRDYRLVRRTPVSHRFQYQVESHLNFSIARRRLSPEIREKALAIPANYNPRTLTRARQWRQEAKSDQAYIDRVLKLFNREFTYTLQPPLLGRDSVDEFLWETQSGFCEHFASAFVVLMRAAGIPARVVTGYQGGELNPLKNFLVVKQADAHAWSEVWLAGEGWVRVDPTAAVAPQRIEAGLDGALSVTEAEMLNDPFSLESYSRMPLFNRLRLRLEVLEYDWHRWVMNYDTNSQTGLLRELLGAVTPLRVAGVLLLSGVLVLAFVGVTLVLSGRRTGINRADRIYLRFLRQLRRHGIRRKAGEGPRALARRVAKQRPELQDWAKEVTGTYERCVYGYESQQLAQLRSLTKRRWFRR